MLVSHVSLQEVLVAELFVAELAVSFNVEDLAPIAWCEALFHLGSRHVHGRGWWCRAGEHEVRHFEGSIREEVGVACGCNSVPLQLLLRVTLLQVTRLQLLLRATQLQVPTHRLVHGTSIWVTQH